MHQLVVELLEGGQGPRLGDAWLRRALRFIAGPHEELIDSFLVSALSCGGRLEPISPMMK